MGDLLGHFNSVPGPPTVLWFYSEQGIGPAILYTLQLNGIYSTSEIKCLGGHKPYPTHGPWPACGPGKPKGWDSHGLHY